MRPLISLCTIALAALFGTIFAFSASAVVLTNGDGVIRNSLCVGFDCPNAPAFDDSTILMMENNTRIKFGDTSNAPFPNNDWEIEANSSLSGGQSYLGINDCGTADNDGGCATDLVFAIEAGARASALYVQSDGDIGIGTSNPVLDVHVVTGNTPALRLDQDGSSGFTPQVWDLAGNETNFFVRDVTSGSRLPFRIQPNAPTNSIFVAAAGDIGLGTSAPTAALHVNGTGGKQIRLESTDGGAAQLRLISDSDTNRRLIGFDRTLSVVETQISLDNTKIVLAGTTVNGDDAWATVNTDGIQLPAGSAFSVNGTNLNVPDYVFAPDYPLMPLGQLERFIAANRHLPKIPSAGEVRSGGLNMTQMQLALLEKVEELTLYTIEQQKTIDALLLRLEAPAD